MSSLIERLEGELESTRAIRDRDFNTYQESKEAVERVERRIAEERKAESPPAPVPYDAGCD